MSFLSLLVALTAAGVSGPANASRTSSVECRVGEAVLDRMLGGRRETDVLIVSGQPIPPLELPSPNFAGKADAVVPAAMMAAWKSAAPSNLFQACPHLERRLPAGWRYARPDEEAALDRPLIRSFGKPLVRGDLALVEVGTACSGLCGTITVQLYRRTHGRWRYVAPAAVAIS